MNIPCDYFLILDVILWARPQVLWIQIPSLLSN
jgi:hypothetical protein